MHKYATKWNEEHGNEINIRAYQDVSGTYKKVDMGRIDAFIDSNFVAHSRIKKEGLPLKIFSEKPLFSMLQRRCWHHHCQQRLYTQSKVHF
ncbi:hypothetical protein [Paenibacillus alvei]|uniref:hypothetical protein n=1 Tax=Paenibacillus alvei TaxID=44250 RepID=UPI001F48C532|nr:hypothetical protein [Paenibacillus alvei]